MVNGVVPLGRFAHSVTMPKPIRAFRAALLLTVTGALLACQAETDQPVLPELSSVDFAHQASDLVMDEAITYGRLPNGLRYAVMENATPTNTATLLMRVDAGSLDETEATRGLAHFLEHMAFNGSENIPEGEMTKRLERLGLAFGADTNASTSLDQTIYQLELPDTSDALLDEALMIFRETAERLTLDTAAIDRERGVILAEKRARNSPNYRAFVDFLDFQTEPAGLADRLPIGEADTINSVTPEDFRSFYDAQYRPEDTFVVLVGDRPAEAMAAKIEAAFGDWKPRGNAADDAEIAPFAFDAPRTDAFFDPEVTTRLTLFTVAPPRPETRERDTVANRAAELPLYYAYAMLNRRYSRMVSRGEAAFTGAGAGTSTSYGDTRVSSLTVVSEHEAIEEAFQQAERELRRALDQGFTQAEFDEQRADLRKAYEVAVQTAPTRRTPGLAREILSSFANETVMTSAASELDMFDAAMESLSLEDAEAALREAWSRLDTAPQLYLRSDTEIEDADAFLAEMLEASRAVSLPPMEEADAAEWAYADWGEPGSVAERGRIEDIGITTVRFDNNVRLNIKTTPYETDRVRIRVRAGQGSGQFDPDDGAFTYHVGAVLGRSGLGAHDVDEINTVTAGRTVGVRRGFGQEAMTLSGTTVPEDLELQLQLMAAHLVDPGYREEVLGAFQSQIRQFWDKIYSTPVQAAAYKGGVILTDNHPTSRVPDEADVVDVDIDEVRRWYDTHVRGGAVEISVVGDVDEDAVIDAVARTFGTLDTRPDPATDIRADRLDYQVPAPTGAPYVVTHSGEPDTAMVRVHWPVPNHEDTLLDRLLAVLADVLGLELTERLREREGATYSPSTYTSLPFHNPDYGYVVASVEVAPEEVARVQTLIEDAAADIAEGGIDLDLFQRAIKPTLERLETSLENNGYWLGVIDEAQSDAASLDRHRTRDAMFQNMTAEALADVAREVFTAREPVVLHVLPER